MELKRIEDYYDKVQEKFPELTREQIDKILKFGFRSFYTHTLYGGDVLSKSPYFTMYCGKVFSSNVVFYNYWLLKTRIKLRIKYKRTRTQYDGYYYFGLSEDDFQYYLSQKKKTGRRRQKFHFKRIKLFKIVDEVICDRQYKHIFKIPYPVDNGFTIWREDVITRDFEYIYKRNKDNTIEPISYESKRNK